MVILFRRIAKTKEIGGISSKKKGGDREIGGTNTNFSI